jgi:hypothetical protein
MRRMAGTLLVVAAVGLSSCAAQPGPTSSPLADVSPVATYTFVAGPGSPVGGSDAALAEGVLTFSDGCVRFENGVIPLFPDSLTKWDGTTVMFNGESYQDGDFMSVAGGFRDDLPVESTNVPQACGPDRIFWVGPGN